MDNLYAELQSYANKISSRRNALIRYAFLFALLMMLAVSLYRVWQYGMMTNGFDFFEKWEIGQRIQQGNVGILYSPDLLDLHISSPFLYAVISFFSTGNYAVDVRIFRLLCLLSSVGAIIILSRLLRYPLWFAAAIVILLSFWFQPLLSDLRVANVNQLQLGALALFLLLQSRRGLRGRDFIGGLILGAAVMAKPNLLFVVVMLLAGRMVLRRRRSALEFSAGIGVAAVAAVGAAGAVFGNFSCWLEWLKILPQASTHAYSVEAGNYSPTALSAGLTSMNISPYLSALLIGLAFVSHHAGARKKAKASNEGEVKRDILLVATGSVIYLLSASLVWIHYYLLTIPMILFVFRPRNGSRAPFSLYRITWYILASIATVLIAELPLRKLFSITDPYHGAMLMILGTCVLYGLGIWELLFENGER